MMKIEAEKTIVKRPRSFFAYVQDLKSELKKVSWTSRGELVFATKSVVLTMVFFGFGVYVTDFLIKSTLDSIRVILRFVFG